LQKGFEVVPATQEIVQQFADLLGSISSAAADNAITGKEATLIREVWDELKRHTEGFVKCCEEGDFANLPEVAKRKNKPPVKSGVAPAFQNAALKRSRPRSPGASCARWRRRSPATISSSSSRRCPPAR